MTENENSIQTTVEGFKVLTKGLEAQRWQGSHSRFNNLLVGWRAMQPLIQLLERASAPSYNIFYVLKNMRANEVKLHSPFLADLFNVHGEHKQGSLFYEELLKILRLPTAIYLPTDLYHLNAQTEVDSGTGGIDIVLSCRNNSDYFAIAIENKIYAGDQHKQLERYHSHLQKEFGKCFALVYLTPEGRTPSDYSASADFISQHSIVCLSYRKDIVGLLQKTIPFIQAPHVRAITEQYLAVCQSI